jgi:hypothetical protein
MPRPAGLRGMRMPDPSKIHLKFHDYIDHSKLPALPQQYGHVVNNPRVPWGMLGNNQAGDCVVAGGCHETMIFAMASRRKVPTFRRTWAQNYSEMLVACGDKPYDPNDDSTDVGLDPHAAAGYRRSVGLLDDDGNRHQIDAYALITNINELMMATYLFGVAGLGLAIPDSAEKQFESGEVWDDLKSQPHSGHYPPAVGFNSKGNIVLSTWSDLQAATPDYVERYWAIGVAYLSKEYMLASGKSPELIDWAALEDDLGSVITMA